MLESFHFIEPWWLLALMPLLLLAWRVYRPGSGADPWRRVVDAALQPLLLIGRSRAAGGAGAPWLIALGWTVAVVALANPTWERQPQRVYQSSAARVIVLDLSPSMNANDLPPSRLARARFKVEDILARNSEGQTGLVAYAGDAFTVSPLTRDANTIRALLKALDPAIMPMPGSRADLGLLKAGELLRQAGASTGQVVLIADGVDADKHAEAQRAAARLLGQGYHVSVLGVGSDAAAAPASASVQIAATGDARDGAAVPKLDEAILQSIAGAGGGQYRQVSASGAALQSLLDDPGLLEANKNAATGETTTPTWKERGPLLVLLLIPLAALAFRRNWLLSGLLLVGLASPPQQAVASTWSDLWQRPDQQAAQAMTAGDYASASKVAQDPDRRGTALYKLGDYQRAVAEFTHASGTDADYNRGNALAKLGRYQEAIAAYDKSLEEDGGNKDALANKKAVEDLLKKQPPQDSASPPPSAASQKQQDQGQSGQQGSGQGGGSRENSGKGKDSQQDRSSNDGKGGQDAAASGDRQPSPGSHGNGKQDAASSGDQQGSQGNHGDGKNDARSAQGTQAQASGAGSKQADKGVGAAQAQPGKGAPHTEASTSTVPMQHGSGNQFADAAKQLAAQNGSSGNPDVGATEPPPAAGAGTASEGRPGHSDAHRASGARNAASELNSEEQMAAEQWLRRIPDDPGGLLRRKFLYQYRQRAQHPQDDDI
ncbi:MAG: VWA domain-containing protein [Casimicrobiaceae bacterium]